MKRVAEFVRSVGEWMDWQEAHRSREEMIGIVIGVELVLVWIFICFA